MQRKFAQEINGESKYGLTPPQFFMLHLLRKKGPSKVTALAEQLEVKPSAITVMIDRLVQQGFAERQPDPNDRRVVLVGITPVGRQALELFDARRKEIAARFFNRLEPEELEQMIALFEKMIKD